MVSIKFCTIIAITYRISGGTRRTGTAYNPSEAPEFTLGFSGVRIAQSLLFPAVFCRSLFVSLYFFLLATVLSVLLRFTSSKLYTLLELLTLPEHLSSPYVFSGVRVTRSLVLSRVVCYVTRTDT